MAHHEGHPRVVFLFICEHNTEYDNDAGWTVEVLAKHLKASGSGAYPILRKVRPC